MALGDVTQTRLDRRTVQQRVHGWRLEGADELEATLRALEESSRTKIIKAGLAAGAEIVRNRMAENARRFSRRLAAGIVAPLMEVTKLATARAEVGPHYKVQHLGYWAEWGTKPHAITPFRHAKKKAAAAFVARGGKYKKALAGTGFGPVAAVENHPGMAPRPFAVSAFIDAAPRALQEIGRVMWAGIRDAASRRNR